MKMQTGEVLDRLSILLHKVEKIGSAECYREFFAYAKEVLMNFDLKRIDILIDTVRALYEVNGRIWNLEADLRKGKENLAAYAIKFHIKKKFKSNSSIILSRLKQRESENMEKLALEYIEKFKLSSSGSLLIELSKSSNEEIQKKANELIKKLNIKEGSTS